MKIVSTIVLPVACLIPFSGECQMRGNGAPLVLKSDTMWFDLNWQITTKPKAYFYRIYKKRAGGYDIWDRYKNHSIQMTAFSTTINPLYKEGTAYYYNNNGFLSSVTTYKNNFPVGKSSWYWKNETDSSVVMYGQYGGSKFIYGDHTPAGNDYTDGFSADLLPVLEQGVPNLHDVLAASVVYPAEAKNNNIKGRTIVRFTVNKDGTVSDVKVEVSSGKKYFDDEAVRVVKLLPKFKPGKKNGVAVACNMVVPIRFPFK